MDDLPLPSQVLHRSLSDVESDKLFSASGLTSVQKLLPVFDKLVDFYLHSLPTPSNNPVVETHHPLSESIYKSLELSEHLFRSLQSSIDTSLSTINTQMLQCGSPKPSVDWSPHKNRAEQQSVRLQSLKEVAGTLNIDDDVSTLMALLKDHEVLLQELSNHDSNELSSTLQETLTPVNKRSRH
ncbi:hypothetical protein GEMRC1_004254 [Eukaryota sp. GEM-RC1]